MQRFVGFIYLAFIAALMALPIVLVATALEPSALAPAGSVRIGNVAEIQSFLERNDLGAFAPGETRTVRVTEAELNSVIATITRAAAGLGARVEFDEERLRFAATLTLPAANVPARHLNLRGSVLASPDGLVFADLALGRWPIPAVLARRTLETGIAHLLDLGPGANLLDSIGRIDVDARYLAVSLTLGEATLARLAMGPSGFAFRRANSARASDEGVQPYYALVATMAERAGNGAQSLLPYVRALFTLAQTRSAAPGGDAVAENRAAVVAMALHLGHTALGRIADALHGGFEKRARSRFSEVRLGGRDDLAQHFIVFAGIALAADPDLADAIGTLKELEDIGRGSGFSFTDLAANRAGIRLARAASAPATAQRLQRMLSGAGDEGVFFPEVADLPEELGAKAFRRRFGDRHDRRYRAMLAEIDRRIEALALYRESDHARRRD